MLNQPDIAKTAEVFVRDGLTACPPPGVPLMGHIMRAEFAGKQKAIATLIMFDGQLGRVEVSKWGPFEGAWCIAWQDTGNTDCHWNGSAWERVAPIRMQLNLFDGERPLTEEG